MKPKHEGFNWPTTTIARSAYLRGRIGWQGLKASEFIEEGPFLVTGTDFTGGRINWDSCYHVSESRYAEAEYIHLKNDDVLITKDGTIGKVALVKDCPEKAVLNSGIFLLRCNDNSFQHRYIFHVLKSNIFRKFLDDNLAGSTIQHLYQHVFVTFEFPVPDPFEQAKIAEILSTLDRAIEQTEALIAKQQRIKTGLMQDLLTHGIDQHGTLRSEQTHRYKTSPLGKIPEEWEIQTIEDIADVAYGISDAIDPNNKSGTPTITLPCVSPDGNLQLDPAKLAFSPNKAVKESDILQNGDLLFNWRNGSQNHLGKTAYFCGGGRFTHVGFLLKIRTLKGKSDSRFLWFLINNLKSKGYFLTAKIQVNNTFNSSELRAVRLPMPTLDEQKIIRKRLDAAEEAISGSQARLMKLRSLHMALMQDLLTGKKRVTPLLDPVNHLTERAS